VAQMPAVDYTLCSVLLQTCHCYCVRYKCNIARTNGFILRNANRSVVSLLFACYIIIPLESSIFSISKSSTLQSPLFLIVPIDSSASESRESRERTQCESPVRKLYVSPASKCSGRIQRGNQHENHRRAARESTENSPGGCSVSSDRIQ
jgi:hypothetical protein